MYNFLSLFFQVVYMGYGWVHAIWNPYKVMYGYI